MTRRYRSGSRWAVWRWTETPSGYLTRLHLLQTPYGAIMLHWINGPDPEPHLHDHPTTFASVILRGWYVEEWRRLCRYEEQSGVHVRRWWNFIRAAAYDRHRIVEVAPGGALTLCFMTPKRREWGFHTQKGWVYWKIYNEMNWGGGSKIPPRSGSMRNGRGIGWSGSGMSDSAAYEIVDSELWDSYFSLCGGIGVEFLSPGELAEIGLRKVNANQGDSRMTKHYQDECAKDQATQAMGHGQATNTSSAEERLRRLLEIGRASEAQCRKVLEEVNSQVRQMEGILGEIEMLREDLKNTRQQLTQVTRDTLAYTKIIESKNKLLREVARCKLDKCHECKSLVKEALNIG